MTEYKIVRILGDQSARVAEDIVFDELITKLVPEAKDFPIYDLSVQSRDKSEDKITEQAAEALMQHKVGVKSPTVTVKEAQFEEFGVSRSFGSPNGKIRKLTGGEAIIREALPVPGLSGLPVPGWTNRLITARHPVFDVYGAPQFEVEKGSKVELVIHDKDGNSKTNVITEFAEESVMMVQYNTVAAAKSFAKVCVQLAIDTGLPLVYGHKDTILPVYHGIFLDAFEAEVASRESELKEAGSSFTSMLNDAVAIHMVSKGGGVIYALNNYEGDLYSDVVGGGVGSIARVSSALYSANNVAMFDPAGGTAPSLMEALDKEDGFFGYNPLAHIAAWRDALNHASKLQNNVAAKQAAATVWDATQETYRAGYYTPDLKPYAPQGTKIVTCSTFVEQVYSRCK